MLIPSTIWNFLGLFFTKKQNPGGIYLFQNTWTMCEICSKLTIKISDQHQWYQSDIRDFTNYSRVFIVDFEQVILAGNIRLLKQFDNTCSKLTLKTKRLLTLVSTWYFNHQIRRVMYPLEIFPFLRKLIYCWKKDKLLKTFFSKLYEHCFVGKDLLNGDIIEWCVV